MTTAQAVGAVSRDAAEWYGLDWQAIHRNVRRLQVRIVQATKASRWGKVRALQRLLTHSYSGKVLAVRRVTENNGKKAPGVDNEIWDTPEKKIQAVHALKRRGYGDTKFVRRRSEWWIYPWTEWINVSGSFPIVYGEGSGFGSAFATFAVVGVGFAIFQCSRVFRVHQAPPAWLECRCSCG